MDHYDRLGNNVDLSNADEGEEDERYVGLPEDDDYFDPQREAMEDELGASYGDPRRCIHHPSEITSSPDGMFDAPCGYCEHEGEHCEEDDDDVGERNVTVTPVVVVEEDDDICF
jgi:hypothetical protein